MVVVWTYQITGKGGVDVEIDFDELEKLIYEKYEHSFPNPDDVGLALTIGKIAAKVATLAIYEYHQRVLAAQSIPPEA